MMNEECRYLIEVHPSSRGRARLYVQLTHCCTWLTQVMPVESPTKLRVYQWLTAERLRYLISPNVILVHNFTRVRFNRHLAEKFPDVKD